jgi:TetR/AcrR family transcriptional regulator
MTDTDIQALVDPGARERLLKSAATLFARKGYAATTVREIVEAAGVTKPVLYYYFRSKEGLFQDLTGLAIAAHDALLEEIHHDPGTPTEKIRLLFDRVFALIQEHAEVVRMLDAVYYGPPESSPPFDFDRLYGAFHRNLRQFVEEGVRCGELRPDDVDVMTLALLGGWVIAVDNTTCCHEHGLGTDGVARVRDYILAGLRAGGRGQGEER